MTPQDQKQKVLRDIGYQTELDVLGYLLHAPDRESKFEIVQELEPSDFRNSENTLLYKTLIPILINTGNCDIVLVGNAIKTESPEVVGRLVEIPAQDYLPVTREKVGELRGRRTLARISELALTLNKSVDEHGADVCLKMIEDFVFGEYRRQENSLDFKKALTMVIDNANDKSNWGYNWIDMLPRLRNVTNGIERGKTYIIGGLKKSGKTRFAVRMMKTLMVEKINPLFLSMEMKAGEVAKLFLSAYTNVPTSFFNRELAHADEQVLRSAVDKISELMNLDTESFLTIEKIRAKVWRAVNRGCNVVVIDYLQRMSFAEGKNSNRATVIADTCARLADIGRDHNVAMIILSQLRSESEGEEIGDMRHLKDSGGIAEAGDAILILTNRQRQMKGEAKYASSEEIDFWISVEQRNGETALIKAKAKLGRLQFYESVNESDPVNAKSF